MSPNQSEIPSYTLPALKVGPVVIPAPGASIDITSLTKLTKDGISEIQSLGDNQEVEQEVGSRVIPEKIQGLKKLFEHGFPVPEINYHLTQLLFPDSKDNQNEELRSIILNLINKAKQENKVIRIIIRSAHPCESSFPGGTFESVKIGINGSMSVDDVINEILSAQKRIIKLASPDYSIKLIKGIESGIEFNPNDMEFLLNNDVGGRFSNQITVVPLTDGGLSLRFYEHSQQGGSSFSYANAITVNRSNIKESANELQLFFNLGIYNLSKVNAFKNQQGIELIERILSAQDLFRDEGPQEMEIIVNRNGYHFVQTKRVEVKEEKIAIIPMKEFNLGERQYREYRGREVVYNDFIVERTTKLDEIRELKALVIDESCLPKRFLMSKLQVNNDFLLQILDFYREIRKLAIDIKGGYIIFCKQINLSQIRSKLEWLGENNPTGKELIDEIMIIYNDVYGNADVVFRGESDIFSGCLEVSHHDKFGVSGLNQIGIYHRNCDFFNPNFLSGNRETSLCGVNTGDDITVMVQNQKASILVQH